MKLPWVRVGLVVAGLVACGGDEASELTGICGRLRECEQLTAEQVQSCRAQVDDAMVEQSSCELCLEGAECRDIASDACMKPCTGVTEYAGTPPPPSGPSAPGTGGGGSGGRPPQETPEEIRALCGTLAECQIRVSQRMSCEGTLAFGVQSNNVTLREIDLCNRCMMQQFCSTSACAQPCARVLRKEDLQ